jgi:hypothetical protein
MEPTYRPVPVSDYLHDGVYIVDSVGFPAPYRFDSGPGGLTLIRDDKLYAKSDPVSREWFCEHVLGLVVGHVRLPSSLRDGHGQARRAIDWLAPAG